MGCLGNLIWFLFGIPIGCQCFKMASLAFFPFGIQCFKIAKLALMPFGTVIINN